MQIYVFSGGAQHGPYSAQQIREYLANGQIQPGDPAWREGLPDWRALEEWPEFAQAGSSVSKPALIFASALTIALLAAGVFLLWPTSQLQDGSSAGISSPAESHSGSMGALGTGSEPVAMPNTFQELSRLYPEPPPGKNAAVYYLKAAEALEITAREEASPNLPRIGKGRTPALEEKLSPATMREIELLVNRAAPALELIEQGSQFRQASFPLDLSKGIHSKLPHLSQIHKLAKVLALKSLWHSERNEAHQAAHSIELLLALSRSLESEPTTVSQLARTALLNMAVSTLEQSLSRTHLQKSDLESLLHAFQALAHYEQSGASLNTALLGDRVMLLMEGKEKEKMLMSAVTDSNISEEKKVRVLTEQLKPDYAFLDETFQYALDLREADFPARMRSDLWISQRSEEAMDKSFIVSALFRPVALTDREAKTLTGLRFSIVALALQAFQQDHERYPATLNVVFPLFNRPLESWVSLIR